MRTCTALTPSSGIEPPGGILPHLAMESNHTHTMLSVVYLCTFSTIDSIGCHSLYCLRLYGIKRLEFHNLRIIKEGYNTQSLPGVLTLPLFSVPLAGNIMKGDPLKMNLLRRHLIRCYKLRVISSHETVKCSPCFFTVLIVAKKHRSPTTTYGVYMVIVYADVISIYID